MDGRGKSLWNNYKCSLMDCLVDFGIIPIYFPEDTYVK